MLDGNVKPFYESFNGSIFCGDCVELMKKLPDSCIHLTVTSPPYDNLRKYKGFEWDFESTAKELFRVTKQGGIVVWVVGDSTAKGSETGSSFRQALFFKECGFNLHDTMIYEKINPIPQNHNRYEQCFEYMFVFSKGKPSTFNPLKEDTKHAGKTFNWGGRKTILDKDQCRRHRGDEMIQVKNKKTKRNIFRYSVGGGNTGHPAVFPFDLAKDHILSWSNEGDLVLDPFGGSGTTALAAIATKRSFISIDISEEYCDMQMKRVKECDSSFVLTAYEV